MTENPIFRKELLTRYRNRQARGLLFIFLLIIGLIVALTYYLVIMAIQSWNSINGASANAGSMALVWITIVQFVLICLIAPAAAANSITQEKEQQTWDMLLFTRLTPFEIILGKLGARLVPVLGIILLFAPLSFYCLVVALASGAPNGIDFSALLRIYTLLVLSATLFTTVGLAASWWTKRTIYAIMVSYTTVIGGLTIATVLLTTALGSLSGSYGFEDKFPVMWLNPVYLMMLAMRESPSRDDMLHLMCGLLGYGGISAGLIWIMIARFRNENE